jgi:glycosyltransferase involved in cell wall biosynthesis
MDGVYDASERIDSGVSLERLNIAAPKKQTIRNALRFRNYLRTRKPDLLVTYNWGALEWALANKPKIVPHIHFEDGFSREEAKGQLLRRVMMRRLILRRSVLVVPSLTLKRLALDCWRLPAKAIRYIPNGIDCTLFNGKSDGVPVPSGMGPVIGTVAGLRPEKNIARLIRAFAIVRRKCACRLVISGDGSERSTLEVLARNILPSDSYIFTGHVSQVEQVYPSLDIFALPSDTEQMPTSLMEAMASGLPIVSTDVGDVSNMITEENRRFVVPQDDELFADALFQLISDENTRKGLGEQNRAFALKRFDVETMFRNYDLLFESACS